MLRVVRIFVLMPLFAQAAYDLRISYTGDKNAPTTIKTQYCKGTTIKCGKQTKVSSNGVLLFKAYYENGEYEGEVLSYYNDGSLQERRTYNKGKEEGKRVFYYPNGKIQSEQEYVSNKREGEGKTYYENGVLRAEFTYKNDRLHGIRPRLPNRWFTFKLKSVKLYPAIVFSPDFFFEAFMMASVGMETNSNQERLRAMNKEVLSFTKGPEKLKLAEVSPMVKCPRYFS